MTTQDDIRIPYKPELYVPREKAELEVQKWLARNGRLLTITSPPATGKSWFLRERVAKIEGWGSDFGRSSQFLRPDLCLWRHFAWSSFTFAVYPANHLT